MPTAPARWGVADDAVGDQAAAARRLVEGLEWINAELSVPSPAQYGITREKWDALTPLMAEQALASGSPGNNPRVPDAGEIAGLYGAAWG
jgi:alcohol dehydrogenase class IV